ncbi:hypothetical protein F2Q69_00013090 [Brassica cretica]|uniref:Uncharacterized protein n=1 Tax=Brassica cretica TaxID=69181 RepID=A0A8S9R5Y5_BRACR|nr:hypothetical protein F2Q69_00013090 [Brassica cretica]
MEWQWNMGACIEEQMKMHRFGSSQLTDVRDSSVATSVVSGLLALLRVELDKIGAAPYDGCLRTLVDGIKPFVVRLGVKWEDNELSSRNLTLCELLYFRDLFREFSAVCKLVGFLKTLEYWPRDKFWDLVSGCLILCRAMLEISVLGLRQDQGLITALRGAMTTLTYVLCIVFDLIPSSFKVRDMFSAYVTCMVGIEHPFEDNL